MAPSYTFCRLVSVGPRAVLTSGGSWGHDTKSQPIRVLVRKAQSAKLETRPSADLGLLKVHIYTSVTRGLDQTRMNGREQGRARQPDGATIYNLQSTVCGLRSAVCGLRSAVYHQYNQDARAISAATDALQHDAG
ncbi:hypothetical protein E4U42_000813, partial [Claviceps africana]